MENGIPEELITRINELARKKKSKGLTQNELQEQKKLRNKYLKHFRKNFRSQVEMLQVYDKHGKEVTPEKVKNIQRDRGLRDD
ncbi:hypothetical protein LFYK43_15360 [Ligilactobacillus salitolerans]|uniref:UPF0291 protein LFYK43_15360 n=1 Tax=Ligilactobacillus salitolerans TaxID=1808352 RepID=A0A401IUA2_9LACO|nr:DUF896 domain-containing protein [Ligilactobacillus salitolerans]GBG95077.1 hypothetical protein LFYK43_15360 [Ligilactobacillus salitolerans]